MRYRFLAMATVAGLAILSAIVPSLPASASTDDVQSNIFDIGIGPSVGSCYFPFVCELGIQLNFGIRMINWVDKNGRHGSLRLDINTGGQVFENIPILAGVRLQADMPMIRPYFVVRGGGTISIYNSSYAGLQISSYPLAMVGGGFSVPGNSRISLNLETNFVITEHMFNTHCDFECATLIPFQFVLYLRLRPPPPPPPRDDAFELIGREVPGD